MAVKDQWRKLFRSSNRANAQRAKRTGEYGFTGSKVYSGLPMEEYNPELAFPVSTKVYDQMRRSDGQVASLLSAMSLPIRSTEWFVTPEEDADDQNLAQDIADFIQDNLFNGMKYSWDDHLREALLMLVFGFSVFEKVYKMDVWNGKPVIVLDKLAPRVAPSIWRFPQNQNNDIEAVEQINYMSGQIVSIPLDKCLVYTYQREGDNIVGISVLRPAYKHWFIKDSLYKIVAVGIEKSLIGTPIAKVPKGTSEEESEKILGIISSIRAAEEAGATMPDDVEVTMLTDTKNPVDALPYIEHHNIQISRSVLAQFIELGTLSSASGGSYALGNTMVDMFCMSLDAIANYIQGQVQDVIEDIVLWNWGPDAPVPQLQHKPIAFNDLSQVAQAIYWLGAGHALTPDEDLENHIRKLFGLPPMTEDSITTKIQLPVDKYNPDILPDGKLTPEQIAAIQQRVKEASGSQGGSSDGSSDGGSSAAASNSANNAAMSEGNNGSMKFDDNGEPAPVKWRRDLTDAEKRVQFDDLDKEWRTQEEKFVTELKTILGKSTDQMINQIDRILADNNKNTSQKITAINSLTAPLLSKYQDAIQLQAQQAYQYGAKTTAAELGVDASTLKTTQADAALIKAKAVQIAQLQLQKVTSAVAMAAVGQVQRGVPDKQVIYGCKQTAHAYINGPDLKAAGMVTISENINVGRGSAAKQIGVQGAQYSALMDSHTCPLCEELDGKVISVDNPDFDLFRPPLHIGCRCVLVYIGTEEKDVKFDWETPSHSLVKRYGGLVNA